MTIQLNVLNERAMEVIRYLEKVKDVEVIISEPNGTDDQVVMVNGVPRKQRKWGGILADHDTTKMEAYFDNIRDEWIERI